LVSLAVPELTDSGLTDAVGSVTPMCAPPLLLIVTPGATWVLEDVVPVSVVVVPVPVVVAEDEVELPSVDVAADPVDDSPVGVELDVESAELGVPVVSAAAQPWPVATAVTSHAATAIPP
jgi:hypothetical protein